MPAARRVTLESISRELNLSPSSVSRALRNDPLIHPETRARVNVVAARLGYQGRSRRGPRKDTNRRTVCAVFAAQSLTDIKSYVNMMAYLQGITSEAESTNMALTVHPLPPGSSTEESGAALESLFRGEADAMILAGIHDPGFVSRMASAYPLVSLVHNYPDVSHDLVSTDNVDGLMTLVAKLTDAGHKKLAWISDEDDQTYSHARRAGFLEGCLAAGLPFEEEQLMPGVFKNHRVDFAKRICRLVEQGTTAIVCSSDHAAYEVWSVLAEAGISVPETISLTGFDAVGEPGQACPKFTTFDPRFAEIGRMAVRLLQWRLDDLSSAPIDVTVKGFLVEGETVAHPPAEASRQAKGGNGKSRSKVD